MKFFDKKYLKFIILGIILILAYKVIDNIAYLTDALKTFIAILSPVIIGAVIAFFTYRPSKLIAKHISKIKNNFIKKKSLTIGVLIVYSIIAVILSVAFHFVIPVVINNIQDLIAHVPSYYSLIMKYIQNNETLTNLTKNATEKFVAIINADTINYVISLISTIANYFMTFFIGVIFSVYFILYKDRLATHLINLRKLIFKDREEFKIFKYARKIINLFYAYFTGLALDALLIGTVTGIVLALFNVPYAVLLGLVVAFGNMIPFFGAIIAAIVIYIVCALTFGPIPALWSLAFQLVLGQIDGNIIQPRILSHSVGISPLTVLLTVVILGEIFGPLGMILGVPIVAALKLVIYNEN